MAKEICLIGVGPEGRDSLPGTTLKILQEAHLIVGGKRVIDQFEDLGVPTYAMTANLRQLLEVIGAAEEAVMGGGDVAGSIEKLPVTGRGGKGGDEDDNAVDEEEGEGEEEGGRGRRRGRRRQSPRSRGRGKSSGNDAGTEGSAPESGGEDAGGGKEKGKSRRGVRSRAGKKEGPGDAPAQAETSAEKGEGKATGDAPDTAGPDTSMIDAGPSPAEMTIAVSSEGAGEPQPAPEGGAGDAAVATEEAPEDTGTGGKADKAEEPAARAAKADTPEEKKDSGREEASPTARIAILASGDPNFYGLSKFLLERFKKEEVSIIPHVSAIQMAFAAIKEPMNDAAITSSSGRNVDRLIRVVKQNTKVGIFTDKRRSPRAVAKLLKKHNIEAQCYVCQDLGTPRERIIMGSLEEIEKKNFSPLSVMILFKSVSEEAETVQAQPKENKGGGKARSNLKELPEPARAPKYELITSLGIPDDMLSERTEKIMRAETRVIVLSKLRLAEKSVVWDVGAGCGALSVEAARVSHGGSVFAIEKDFSQIRTIYENIKGFGLDNVTVMEGDIQELAEKLPEPDRIFIGGAGGHMKSIMENCLKRLKAEGIMVVNATTLDALTEVQQVLKENRLKHEMAIVNISRTVERGGQEYFEGFNPSYLVTTVKD